MGKFEDLLEKVGILNPDDPDEIIAEVEGRKEKAPKSPKGKVASAGITVPNIQVPQNVPTEGDNTEVNPSVVAESNIIEEAYSTLSPETDDVYLVEQLEANFSMLPAVQRPAVIISTLTTMGKNVDQLLAGVEARMGAIQQTFTSFSEKIAGENQKLAEHIADYEEKINICKQGQLDRQNSLQAASATVNAETTRLNKIYTILGGK